MTQRQLERFLLGIFVLWLVIALLVTTAKCQVTTALMPPIKTQFLDANGLPLSLGKVCTFQAGTTTPLASYTDGTGSTPNANPVVLDASGRGNIWLGPQKYKISLYATGGDSNCPNSGTLQYTVDSVSGSNLSLQSAIAQSAQAAPTCNAGQYFVWADSTALRMKLCNNGVIDTIVGQNTSDTLTNKTLTSPTITTPTITGTGTAVLSSATIDTETVGKLDNVRIVDGVKFATIQAAITDACNGTAPGRVLLPLGTTTISATLTVPSLCTLEGHGRDNTTLKLANTTNVTVLQNSDQTNGNANITLRGFTIDGNRTNNTSGDGLAFVKVSSSTVQDIHVKSCANQGVHLTDSNDNTLINVLSEDSPSASAGAGIIIFKSGLLGSGTTADRNKLIGCTVKTNRLGISINGGQKNTVIGCYSEGNAVGGYLNDGNGATPQVYGYRNIWEGNTSVNDGNGGGGLAGFYTGGDGTFVHENQWRNNVAIGSLNGFRTLSAIRDSYSGNVAYGSVNQGFLCSASTGISYNGDRAIANTQRGFDIFQCNQTSLNAVVSLGNDSGSTHTFDSIRIFEGTDTVIHGGISQNAGGQYEVAIVVGGGTAPPRTIVNGINLKIAGHTGDILDNGTNTVITGVVRDVTSGAYSAFGSYNAIATVSGGIPAEYATVDLTNQGAAIGTTTMYAVPSTGAGQYRLTWNAKLTTADAVSSTLGALTIVYIDPDGIAQTITAPATIAAGTIATTSTGNTTGTVLIGLPLTLNCKASTNVTYAFAYASNTPGQMKYNLHIKLEAL